MQKTNKDVPLAPLPTGMINFCEQTAFNKTNLNRAVQSLKNTGAEKSLKISFRYHLILFLDQKKAIPFS